MASANSLSSLLARLTVSAMALPGATRTCRSGNFSPNCLSSAWRSASMVVVGI
ncbi:hypothetical protein D3C72_2286960 [compost metagenome]